MPSDSYGLDSIADGRVSPLWWARNRNWENTPNFRNVPKVDLPINGFLYGVHAGEQKPWTYSYTNRSTGSTTVVYTGVYFEYNGNFVSYHNDMQTEFFPYSEWDKQANDALLKALVRISDQKTNLLVALAEAHKTSDLILSTANRLYRSFRAFKRGNFREVANLLNISPRRIHNSWLEYKYGWMPLLMDVKGAAEFFAQKALPERQFVEAVGIVEGTRQGTRTSSGYYYDRPWPLIQTWEGRVRTKVKLRVELTSPHLSEAQQLGLTNPALVAWELVPFSFVFDWFISVGDWLTAQTALVGVTLKTAAVIHEEHTYYKYFRPAIDPFDGSNDHHYGAREAYDTRVQYWRRPLTVDPSTIQPTMKFDLGFQKMITSLALLKGNASRLGRF